MKITIKSERVIPECGQYQGSVSELELAGNVIKTLREMTEIAKDILLEMGKYNLFTNNCQTFANKFLGCIGLESAQYWTTPQQVGAGVAVSIGVVGLAGLAYALFSGDKEEEKKKSSYRWWH